MRVFALLLKKEINSWYIIFFMIKLNVFLMQNKWNRIEEPGTSTKTAKSMIMCCYRVCLLSIPFISVNMLCIFKYIIFVGNLRKYGAIDFTKFWWILLDMMGIFCFCFFSATLLKCSLFENPVHFNHNHISFYLDIF